MQTTASLPPDVVAALDKGKLVEAIKLLRASGMEPVAIKEAVESYMKASGAHLHEPKFGAPDAQSPMPIMQPADTTRTLSPGQVPNSHSTAWWIVMGAIAAVLAYFLMGCASMPAAPVAEMAPSGKLRAAINFGNPILATRGPSGEARGVSVDLAREVGRRLGVPVELVTFEGAGRVVIAQNAEVAAGVRQQLEMDAKRIAGLRVLPGRFMVIEQAMGLPKGRPNGQAWLRGFLEEMKSSGFVAESLKRHGIEGAGVAPRAR